MVSGALVLCLGFHRKGWSQIRVWIVKGKIQQLFIVQVAVALDPALIFELLFFLARCSLCSPVSCDYPEQLESPGSIETPYCQYSSQGGTYQLPQYPQQHQLSQFHHLPVHLASNVLSSVRLTPTTPTESSTSFLPLPGNSGVVTYGTAGATQGYVQNHMGGQLVLQQPSGNSGKFLKSFEILLFWSN